MLIEEFGNMIKLFGYMYSVKYKDNIRKDADICTVSANNAREI